MAQRVPVDSDKSVIELVRQLTDDSRRLVGDEVHLAKLESAEALGRVGKGAIWLALAFGVAVVMLVAFTLFFATLFGRIAYGHYWIGALLTAALEIAAGLWLVQRGVGILKRNEYSLPETREGLKLLRKGNNSPESLE
ncbi:MAG TPA: phage holin family protein [Gemmatimonadaceae bacterium]|nr:phage holin family protein [Gemmatimonadaceae bacterium]